MHAPEKCESMRDDRGTTRKIFKNFNSPVFFFFFFFFFFLLASVVTASSSSSTISSFSSSTSFSADLPTSSSTAAIFRKDKQTRCENTHVRHDDLTCVFQRNGGTVDKIVCVLLVPRICEFSGRW